MIDTITNSNRLAIVANQREADEAMRLIGSDSLCMVSSCYFVSRNAEKNGYSCLDLWEFINPPELESNYLQAWDAVDLVRRNASSSIHEHVGKIVERSANDLVMPLFALFNHTIALRRIFKSTRQSVVFCYKPGIKAAFWDNPHPFSDQLHAAASALASEQKIKINVLGRCAEHQMPPNMPVSKEAPEQSKKQPSISKSFDVLCYCPGRAMDELSEILKHQRPTERSNWLWVTNRHLKSERSKLPLSMLLGLPFDLEMVNNEFTDMPCPDFGKVLQSTLTPYRWELMAVISSVIWPSFLENCMQTARYYAAGNFAAKVYKPSALVMTYDFIGRGRCFQQAFIDAGIPVLSIDHIGCGTPSSSLLHIGARSITVAWGEHNRTSQIPWREKKDGVFSVGSLRSDHVVKNRVGGEREHSLKEPRFTVIVITAQPSTFRMAAADLKKYKQSLTELFGLMKEETNWQFIVQCHPRYDCPQYYHDVFCKELSNVRVCCGNIHKTLGAADVVVMWSNPSTAIIHAIQKNIPVVDYCQATLPIRIFAPVWGDYVTKAHSICSLKQKLQRFEEDPDWKLQCLEKGRQFLDKVLSATGEEAATQMFNLVKRTKLYHKQTKMPSTEERLAKLSVELFDERNSDILQTLAQFGTKDFLQNNKLFFEGRFYSELGLSPAYKRAVLNRVQCALLNAAASEPSVLGVLRYSLLSAIHLNGEFKAIINSENRWQTALAFNKLRTNPNANSLQRFFAIVLSKCFAPKHKLLLSTV